MKFSERLFVGTFGVLLSGLGIYVLVFGQLAPAWRFLAGIALCAFGRNAIPGALSGKRPWLSVMAQEPGRSVRTLRQYCVDACRQALRTITALAIAALGASAAAEQVPPRWLDAIRADRDPASLAARQACRQPQSVACAAEVGLLLGAVDEEPARGVAERLLRFAAEHDHPGAVLELADRVLTAESPAAGLAERGEAERRIRQLAAAGHAGAQALLSQHLGGVSTLPPDDDEAMHWRLRAYRGGEQWLAGSLARAWEAGRGVVPDTAQVIAWSRLQLDDHSGQIPGELASLYHTGRGVPPDPAAAHALWTLSKPGTGSRYDHWVDSKLRRLSLDSPEQARAARIMSAIRSGQRPTAVLDREVKGTPWRWGEARRRPAWLRQSIVWASALEVAADGGARRACAAATGDAPEEVEPVVQRREGERVELRCLHAPVELECTLPTASRPDWSRPVFDDHDLGTPADRCDPWLRGPASVRRDPAAPLRDDTDERLAADMADAVTWYTPKLKELWVHGGPATDSRGRPLPLPESRLRTLLSGRQALVLLWRPDCAACDALAEAMHLGLPRRGTDGVTPSAAQLAIVWPRTGGRDAPETEAREKAQWTALFRRLEGRPFFVADWRYPEPPPGHDLPLVFVFDRHGMLRASTSGRWLHPDQPAWRLATNPQALLDLALHDTVWRPEADVASLDQVLRRAAAGRMPLAPERAPDRITLPSALRDLLVRTEAEATRGGREAALDLFVTRDGIVPSSITPGQKAWVLRSTQDSDRDLRAFAASARARPAAQVHTHPVASIFSLPDLADVVKDGAPALLVIPGGHLMLALPTHRLHAVRAAPVNPQLTTDRARHVMRETARMRIGMPVPLKAEQHSSPLPPRLQAVLRDADPGRRADVAQVIAFADAAGLALYVGDGLTLHRIDSADVTDWTRHTWTGSPRARQPGPEPQLPAHERLMLAMVMRAMAGDREAFCRIRDDDAAAAVAQDFTADVRQAIARAARRIEEIHPELPTPATARAGFLDDQDLTTLLDAAGSLDVAAHGFRAMHVHRTNCLARWVGAVPVAGAPGDYALAAHPASVLPGTDGRNVMHYDGDPLRDPGSEVAFFGNSAKRLGCREIAVQRVQADGSRALRCPGGADR